jgi:alkanesulfonate monooxygenase SsuD/methylene tetrahydromethanopterin reductase-like flavin-dependent oxidoreductase (luciferase family)
MRIGVIVLPEHPWRRARQVWRRVEELGFAHAWTYDHLTWRTFRDEPWYGAVPTLTAAAGVTERIRLGTLVASPNFRHPVPFATELVTLDDVSGGRLLLGIGAGGSGYDAEMLGHPPWSPAERADRFGEFVTVLDRLLVEQRLTYRGRYYSAEEARAVPGCVQQPRVPFYVAGSGPRGMRLAARLGQGWVSLAEPARIGALVARFEAACVQVGRDPAEPARLVQSDSHEQRPLASIEAFRDAVGRYRELGFTDLVVHYPRADAPFRAEPAVLEQVAAELVDGAVTT